MRRSYSLVFGICAVIAGVAVAVSGQTVTWQPPDATGNGQTPIMPVHLEPHHRQVFQHGPMRILDLQVPPGDVSWFHTHEWPVYYLTTSDCRPSARTSARSGARDAVVEGPRQPPLVRPRPAPHCRPRRLQAGPRAAARV